MIWGRYLGESAYGLWPPPLAAAFDFCVSALAIDKKTVDIVAAVPSHYRSCAPCQLRRDATHYRLPGRPAEPRCTTLITAAAEGAADRERRRERWMATGCRVDA